jgi:hypothetical protein
VKWQAKVVLIFLSIVAMIASAQSPTENQRSAQETQVRAYWIDPSTGLMWAGKDNGRDVRWSNALKYCRDLRLAGYSDWRLATIDELQGIFDKSAEAPGLAGKHGDEPFTFHVKGNLFLTGNQWSSDRLNDDRGHPSGYAWRFDFTNGFRFSGDQIGYAYFLRAMCVRRSGG